MASTSHRRTAKRAVRLRVHVPADTAAAARGSSKLPTIPATPQATSRVLAAQVEVLLRRFVPLLRSLVRHERVVMEPRATATATVAGGRRTFGWESPTVGAGRAAAPTFRHAGGHGGGGAAEVEVGAGSTSESVPESPKTMPPSRADALRQATYDLLDRRPEDAWGPTPVEVLVHWRRHSRHEGGGGPGAGTAENRITGVLSPSASAVSLATSSTTSSSHSTHVDARASSQLLRQDAVVKLATLVSSDAARALQDVLFDWPQHAGVVGSTAPPNMALVWIRAAAKWHDALQAVLVSSDTLRGPVSALSPRERPGMPLVRDMFLVLESCVFLFRLLEPTCARVLCCAPNAPLGSHVHLRIRHTDPTVAGASGRRGTGSWRRQQRPRRPHRQRRRVLVQPTRHDPLESLAVVVHADQQGHGWHCGGHHTRAWRPLQQPAQPVQPGTVGTSAPRHQSEPLQEQRSSSQRPPAFVAATGSSVTAIHSVPAWCGTCHVWCHGGAECVAPRTVLFRAACVSRCATNARGFVHTHGAGYIRNGTFAVFAVHACVCVCVCVFFLGGGGGSCRWCASR